MKRLVGSIIALVFASILGVSMLSAPAVAVARPGNTCNPGSGHGRSGCHRVTTSSSAVAAAKAQAARQRVAAQRAVAKRATAKQAAARKAAAAKKATAAKRAAAAAAMAASVDTATVPTRTSTVVTRPVGPKAVAQVPWWIALWHLLVG